MIHELKRPVQALKMCIAFLNDKSMRTDEKAMDEVIHDSMSELGNLSAYLSKLRDMTRADDEYTQLSVRTFDIKTSLESLSGFTMFLRVRMLLLKPISVRRLW